jgi:hypothetical protein
MVGASDGLDADGRGNAALEWVCSLHRSGRSEQFVISGLCGPEASAQFLAIAAGGRGGDRIQRVEPAGDTSAEMPVGVDAGW